MMQQKLTFAELGELQYLEERAKLTAIIVFGYVVGLAVAVFLHA